MIPRSKAAVAAPPPLWPTLPAPALAYRLPKQVQVKTSPANSKFVTGPPGRPLFETWQSLIPDAASVNGGRSLVHPSPAEGSLTLEPG